MPVIRDFLVTQRDHWFVWFPVAMGAGIGGYFSFSSMAVSGLVGVLLAVSALACGLVSRANVRPETDKNNSVIMSFAALMLAGVLLGWGSAQWRALSVDAPILASKISAAKVTGTIVKMEDIAGNAVRILLDKPIIEGVPIPPARIRVTLRGKALGGLDVSSNPERGKFREDRIDIGDQVTLLAMLFPPPRPSIPGGYDFARALWFQQIGGLGYGLAPPRVIEHAETSGLRDSISRGRHKIAQYIRKTLPGQNGTVAAALLVGDSRAIDRPTMDAIRASGLAHILAISGLHMGIVIGLFFVFFRSILALWSPLALYYSIKKWAAGVALVAAFGYLHLSGATIPTQRAFFMASLMLLAVICDRRAISLRVVAWAAIIIFLITPEALIGPSFQMSFAAVTALVAVYEAIRGRFHGIMRFGRDKPFPGNILFRVLLYFGGVLLTTAIASTATLPFAVYHFHQYAVYGMVSNIVAIPLMALWVMPWGIVFLLLFPFIDPVWPLVAMGFGIGWILDIVHFVSQLPANTITMAQVATSALVLVTLGGLWTALFEGRSRWWGVTAIILAFFLHRSAPLPHLLVAEKGQLAALHLDRDGSDARLLVSSRRGRRMIRDWNAALGDAQIMSWRDAPNHAGAPICDDFGCIVAHEGITIAFAYRHEALHDCASVDLMIAFFPVRGRCHGPSTVIDRFDLWRDGVHAITLQDGAIKVDTVRRRQGHFPWTRKPELTNTVNSN